MICVFSRPIPLVLLLAFCTFIPILVAAVSVVQIPLGALPEDSLRLAAESVTFFLHALAGVLFGVLGPMQFVLALRRRFGVLHRVTGRFFALAGLMLALSGLRLLFQVESRSTELLDVARGAFSLALILALALGVMAARARDLKKHRAWMIRAYVIGMGAGTIALVMFPIYLVTGAPMTGLASDIVFVSWWLANIALGEWIIRQLAAPTRRQAAVA